jgi:hypothetical protein
MRKLILQSLTVVSLTKSTQNIPRLNKMSGQVEHSSASLIQSFWLFYPYNVLISVH